MGGENASSTYVKPDFSADGGGARGADRAQPPNTVGLQDARGVGGRRRARGASSPDPHGRSTRALELGLVAATFDRHDMLRVLDSSTAGPGDSNLLC